MRGKDNLGLRKNAVAFQVMVDILIIMKLSPFLPVACMNLYVVDFYSSVNVSFIILFYIFSVNYTI